MHLGHQAFTYIWGKVGTEQEQLLLMLTVWESDKGPRQGNATRAQKLLFYRTHWCKCILFSFSYLIHHVRTASQFSTYVKMAGRQNTYHFCIVNYFHVTKTQQVKWLFSICPIDLFSGVSRSPKSIYSKTHVLQPAAEQ